MKTTIRALAIMVAAGLGLSAVLAGDLECDNLSVSNSITQAGSGGTNVFAGKVGIGTTSPTNDLHVVGDVTVTGQLCVGEVPPQGDLSMGVYTNR